MQQVRSWAILSLGASALVACTTAVSVGNEGGGGTGTGPTVGHLGGGGSGGTVPTSPPSSSGPTPYIAAIRPGGIDKVDLLLEIDNSASMADKQQILAAAVPDLVGRLLNPRCVDATGAPAAEQPTSPTAACLQPTQKREFKPIKDVHIGIVTSSLGGRGSTSLCPANGQARDCANGATNHSNADMGHLIFRTNACDETPLPTYNNLGFLAWDPAGQLSPPGEASITGLVSSLTSMVTGTDQMGCGFEAQLESWYRFLVDPNPYQTISVDSTQSIVVSGTDDVVLAQRKAFLRPDSLLAIVMLTDENDCSIRTEQQYWVLGKTAEANGSPFYLWKARAVCETNPNDPCCGSCAQLLSNCPVDPTCTVNGATATYDKTNDSVNLRCWETKRRFGIDFLYPTSRYTNALQSVRVPDRNGQLVQNPIFSNLSGDSSALIRTPDMVYLSGIVGVPWQLIARTDSHTGQPDLNAGFMSPAELNQNGVWGQILGDPDNYVRPTDLHMVESVVPRIGPNIGIPAGVGLAPVNAPAGTDPINGHEYTVGMATQVFDDLEYACIFDLPQSRDCTTQTPCDCTKENNDNPLCDPDPTTGKRTLQTRAKAYPGIRELSLIKSLGDQGIVGSICPKQLRDYTANDYGYRASVGSIVDRLKTSLAGVCLERALPTNLDGSTDCMIFETHHDTTGSCGCSNWPGHQVPSVEHNAYASKVLNSTYAQSQGANCICEIPQLKGSGVAPNCAAPSTAQEACQCVAGDRVTLNGNALEGWCYIDGPQGIGDPNIVSACSTGAQRTVRVTDPSMIRPGTELFLVCPNP